MAAGDDQSKKLKFHAGKLKLNQNPASGGDARMVQNRGTSAQMKLHEPNLQYEPKKIGLGTRRLKLDQLPNREFVEKSILKPIVADRIRGTENRLGQKIREDLNLPADVARRNFTRGVENRLGDDIEKSLGLPGDKIKNQILDTFQAHFDRAESLTKRNKASSPLSDNQNEVSDALVANYLSRALDNSSGFWTSSNIEELFEKYDAGIDPPTPQKTQVARLANAWIYLKELRRSEDKRKSLDVSLAAAEHFSFARLVGALYGDPTFTAWIAAYYADKKWLERQGRLQELRANPLFPVLPATLDSESWGQKSLLMGLYDYYKTTGKYMGIPFSSRKVGEDFSASFNK